MESTSTSNNSNNPSVPPSSYSSGRGVGEEEIQRAPVEIILASWGDRFLAWLVDFILVSIGLAILFALISIPFWFSYSYYDNIVERVFRGTGPLPYIISSLGFLAYWTYFESSTTAGQSIGKRLLKIKTTDLAGRKIDTKSAIIESFGKAFLLPLDVVLGWIFTNNKRQRIFNRMSKTIVIKLKPKEEEGTAQGIRYTKD
jgi:uncharacterized RDD family membrane protein YckC